MRLFMYDRSERMYVNIQYTRFHVENIDGIERVISEWRIRRC